MAIHYTASTLHLQLTHKTQQTSNAILPRHEPNDDLAEEGRLAAQASRGSERAEAQRRHLGVGRDPDRQRERHCAAGQVRVLRDTRPLC